MTTEKTLKKYKGLPLSLKLGCLNVTVELTDNLEIIGGVSGMMQSDRQRIWVDKRLGPDSLKETMVHELFHYIWKFSYLSAEYPDSEVSSDGEKIIRTLAPYWTQFLRDNPEFTRWLLS